MMNTHMQQMQGMMDSAFGGDPFGGHGGGRSGGRGGHGGMGMGSMMDSMMGGGMMGPGMMGSMGGGGGGSTWSSSSCCYSSSSSGGGQPRVVQYSSSSHGMQRPGEEMVQESHRNYRDSSGQEQLGVSRRIGDRGRSVVAERRADGTEQRTDNLINVNDGTRFDSEWRGNTAATQINDARTRMQTLTQGGGGDPFASMHQMGTMLGGGGGSHHQRPQLTNADREAARAGAKLHEQQRQRIIDEARKQRPGATAAPQIGQGRAPSHRGSASQNADDALASRLAHEEARRAGMYR